MNSITFSTFNRLDKTQDTDVKEVVDELIKIIKKNFDYPKIVAKVHKLSDQEHSTFCSCDGNWSLCCDNPANYPESLLCDECSSDNSFNYTEYTTDKCSCGCLGDWSACENNKENYNRDYTFSPDPSPHRDDNDWYISHDNPLKEPMCDIPLKGTTRTRKIKESYLEECVMRYYNLN
jgi:hypothetical protein